MPSDRPEVPNHLRYRITVAGDGDDAPATVPVVAGPASTETPTGLLLELLPAFPLQNGDLLGVDVSADADGYLTVLLIDCAGRVSFLPDGLSRDRSDYRGNDRLPARQWARLQVPIGLPHEAVSLVVIWTPNPQSLGAEESWSRLTATELALEGEAILLRFAPSDERVASAPPETRGTKYPVPTSELPDVLRKHRLPSYWMSGIIGSIGHLLDGSESGSIRDQALLQNDPVDCAVFAPPRARPGDTVLVQVFAHTIAEAGTAAELAQVYDDTAERRGFKSLEMRVQHGTRLSFHLAMTALTVDDPIQTLTWRGRTESVQFSISIPSDFSPSKQVGTVTISQDGTPLGHIKFALTIEAAATPPARPEPLGEHALRYRRVFISYASRDRTEVLKRVQMLDRFRMSYFQDLLSLEPGARWEQELYKHIDQCDLFLLFWSSAARDSEWVLKEVRYAMARKGGDDANPPEIMPVILEGPPPVTPPEDLRQFHFNDKLRYFMDVPTS